MENQPEKMLSKTEAAGLLDVLVDYMLHGHGPLSQQQRKAIGRMLAEIRFTFEYEPPPGSHIRGL